MCGVCECVRVRVCVCGVCVCVCCVSVWCVCVCVCAGSSGRAALRCGSAAVKLLGLWVRIPPVAWMSVS